MLEAIRQSSQSGATYLLVALLIVVFALFFGTPADGCQNQGGLQYLATVADHDIYHDELGIIMRRAPRPRGETEAQYEASRRMGLRSLALLHLLADQAEDLGLRVSDAELKRYIEDPMRNVECRTIYCPGGEIDGRRYQNYVQNRLGVSTTRYEEFKKRELLAYKYLELAEMQMGVAPDELEAIHELRNDKVNLEFVKFRPDLLQPYTDVSDQEVEAFLASDEGQKAVAAYYEANKDTSFSEPEKISYRRLYIAKPGADAPQEEREKAAQKFAAARKRVMEGKEDFIKVIDEVSEDFAKDKQGLMALTSVENMDQSVVKAFEGAEAGAIKEIETDFAYMLARLEERQPAQVTPLEEAREDIARDILERREVNALIDELSTKLMTKAGEATSLQEAVTAMAVKAEVADGEPTTPAEGTDEEAAPAEGVDGPWQVLQPQETGLFTLEGDNRMPANLPPQLARLGLSLGRPWNDIPKIGRSKELALDAFRELSEEKPLADELYEVDGARVLVRLKERVKPEPLDKLGEEERLALRDEIRGKRVRDTLGTWFELFYVPVDDYGPWLESIYEKALTNNLVRYNEKATVAATLIRSPEVGKITEPPAAEETPAAEEKPATEEKPAAAE